jgi:hypothetical protein
VSLSLLDMREQTHIFYQVSGQDFSDLRVQGKYPTQRNSFRDSSFEFQVVLSVLVRHYVFELPDGPQTVIRKHLAFTPRPTVEGQPPCHVPMRIRRVE